MTAETKRGEKNPAEATEDGQDGFPNDSQLHSIISDFFGRVLVASISGVIGWTSDRWIGFSSLISTKGDEGLAGEGGEKRKKLLGTRQISQ